MNQLAVYTRLQLRGVTEDPTTSVRTHRNDPQSSAEINETGDTDLPNPNR